MIMAVDSHAHVFTRAQRMVAGRRYTPGYDAAIADYLAMLDAGGLSHGVLVQPSFLGVDNSYLLEALAAAPHRLRGIVVVEPGEDLAVLEDLAGRGVVGIRLNLIGRPTPDFAQAVWRNHLKRLAGLDWLVEVQVEAARLPDVLPSLRHAGIRVVVDHFGRPDAELGVCDPGFRYLAELGGGGGIWVKLSGAYRLGPNGDSVAADAMVVLSHALGTDHLVWGSDWPHTQFEAVAAPAAALRALEHWLPDAAARGRVLVETPRRLFGFSG